MPNASAMQELHLNGSGPTSNGVNNGVSNGNGYSTAMTNGVNGHHHMNGNGNALMPMKCTCKNGSVGNSDSNNNKGEWLILVLLASIHRGHAQISK